MIANSDGNGRDQSAIDAAMMERCIRLAEDGIERGELPFATLICKGNDVVVATINQVVQNADLTRHAELIALSEAQKNAWNQRPLRVHALYDRRALRDVFFCNSRNSNWSRRILHQVADDGRAIQMECTARHGGLARITGSLWICTRGDCRPVASRGRSGLVEMESGFLVGHQAWRIFRRKHRK
jgi:cytidine/deoxycytidylate deaminase-like protein